MRMRAYQPIKIKAKLCDVIKPTFPKLEIICFCFILTLLSSCLDAFNREKVSEQTTQVRDYEIEERIYHTADWPDHRYERIYRVSHNGGSWVSLGSFEDESQTGMVHDPIVLNDRLFVFSSAHVFIWRPGAEPIQFYPFEAAGWQDYSQEHGLNGHYDYLAESAWVEGDRWFIQYECVSCQNGKPNDLLFYSPDGGEQFDICVPSAAEFGSCSDD